eukprot:scaffold1192_cov169-Amphora_coffeaeformis.AAC.5
MTSPRSEATCASPVDASLQRVLAFDLYDEGYDSDQSSNGAEVEFSDSENYLTPTNTIPYHFEFPPALIQNKNDNNYYFDLGSVGSDLYLPHPLSSCENTEETETTVLLPSFVKLSKQNIDAELLSMPSFEEAVPDARDEGNEERTLEVEDCAILPYVENPDEVVGGEDLSESRTTERRYSLGSLPANKRPSSSTHPLDVTTSRRKSLGAFAA